jgi:hypothetical protein
MNTAASINRIAKPRRRPKRSITQPPNHRSGLQISGLVGMVGLYLWPWLADRFGRRDILAINIALAEQKLW